MPRFVLPLLILGDIAICVALYFLMGWPALLFAVPLAISTVVIFVVLQGTAMLREAVRTRTPGTHQIVDGSTYDSSGPADWDDTFDTFSSGSSTWDDPGQSHHSSSSHDHHWHSHPSSHDSGSWSSDPGSPSSSDSGSSSSSSDSGSSSSSSSD